MSRPRHVRQPPPLPDDLGWVLVDGDNLLHRARGGRDEGAIRWLLPRLRAWRPQGVRIVLMLDGHPEPGESFRRQVVTGIESHYSGTVDADTALVGLLQRMPYADQVRTVLVTDDRALTDRARRQHASTRRLDWFVSQLASGHEAVLAPRSGAAVAGAAVVADGPAAAPAGPRATGGEAPGRPVGVGAGRPPRYRTGEVDGHPSHKSAGDLERPPWKPGRGATRKSGNPRRGHPPG